MRPYNKRMHSLMKSWTKSLCNNTAHDLVCSTCPPSIFYSVDITTTQKITFQWTCQERSHKLIRQHKTITAIFCVFPFRTHARRQNWLHWSFPQTAQRTAEAAQCERWRTSESICASLKPSQLLLVPVKLQHQDALSFFNAYTNNIENWTHSGTVSWYLMWKLPAA